MHPYNLLISLFLFGTAFAKSLDPELDKPFELTATLDERGTSAEDVPCSTMTVTPVPHALHCATEGTVTHPEEISSSVTSQKQCINRCIKDKACISFSYEPTNSACTLYSASVIAQNFVRGNTGVYYWNHKCYTLKCSCPANQLACGKHCVNPDTNRNNCGSCGHQCVAGTTCSSGKCVSVCGSGQTFCSGSCVTTSSDPNNCGTCGHACGPANICNGGTCTAKCASTSPNFVLKPMNLGGPCNLPLQPPNQPLNDQTGLFFDLLHQVSQQSLPIPFYLNQTAFNYQTVNGSCLGSLNFYPSLQQPQFPTSNIPVVGFVDYLDNHEAYLTFDYEPAIPTEGFPIIGCYIEDVAGTYTLKCTKEGEPGVFYVCCQDWRFGQFVGDGTLLTNCQEINMLVDFD